MDLKRQRLLLLPGGTGNGLARDLGLISLEKAFAAARNGSVRDLDLIRADFKSRGKAHSRLIISTASVGYAAEVVVLANRYFKWLGALCYPLSATIQAALQHGLSVELGMDGKLREKTTLTNLMINNTRHAGNFSAFRSSELNDGEMEVLIARAGFWSQFLHNLAVLSKTYFYRSAAEVKLSSLSIVLPSSQKLMLDGEIWQDVDEVHFKVLPGGLKCTA